MKNDWLKALQEVRASTGVPRQPGHETMMEIAKRIKRSQGTTSQMLIDLGDRVERGKMTIVRSSGKRQTVTTYRLK